MIPCIWDQNHVLVSQKVPRAGRRESTEGKELGFWMMKPIDQERVHLREVRECLEQAEERERESTEGKEFGFWMMKPI